MAVQERILIIKPSSLGDIIHTLPLAHALKRCRPQRSIGWVVERAFQSLLKADPTIDAIYPIHIPSTSDPDAGKFAYLSALGATVATLGQLRRNFKAYPYGMVLDLQASFRSGLLALMNPGGRRVGFADARELNTLFQHEHIAVPAAVTHALDKNLLFASHLGCEVRPEDFFLSTTAEAEEEMDAFLHAAGLHSGTRLVYMQPAARWQSKQWLVERWAQLADRLTASGMQCVFGGSAADLPLLQQIGAAMQHRPLIAAGRLSLLAGAALIKRSALYVGVDTGPMHMAALAGRPVVALFGPTHPERVGPYKTVGRVLQAKGLDCLCCRRRACSHQSCMQGISVEMVEQAVLDLPAQENRNLGRR